MKTLYINITSTVLMLFLCLIPCSTRTLCEIQDTSYQIHSDSLRFIDFALLKGIAYKNMVNELRDEIFYYGVMLTGVERERDSLIVLVNTQPKEVEKLDWKLTGVISLAAVILSNIITIYFLIQAGKK